jgi:hypothetical protein
MIPVMELNCFPLPAGVGESGDAPGTNAAVAKHIKATSLWHLQFERLQNKLTLVEAKLTNIDVNTNLR